MPLQQYLDELQPFSNNPELSLPFPLYSLNLRSAKLMNNETRLIYDYMPTSIGNCTAKKEI